MVFLYVDGLHPLSVANKRHLVATGNNIQIDYITTNPAISATSSISRSIRTNSMNQPSASLNEEKQENKDNHLLILSLHLHSLLYIQRSLDEDFVEYVHECYDFCSENHSNPSFMLPNALPSKRSSMVPFSDISPSDSLGSQIVKISNISISLHYRHVPASLSSFHSELPSLKLFPIEIAIGLLSLSSKSSVMENLKVIKGVGISDSLQGQNEKFNVKIEDVNCIASSDMLLFVMHSLVKNLQLIETVYAKVKMISICSRYQSAIIFYSLLEKVTDVDKTLYSRLTT